MNITNKSFFEICQMLIDEYGQIGLIAVIAIAALVIGGASVAFYFTKIKYNNDSRELAEAKIKLKSLNDEIAALKETVEKLKNEKRDLVKKLGRYENNDYARKALETDPEDEALKQFTSHE